MQHDTIDSSPSIGLDRLRSDFPMFAARCLKIKDKAGQLCPLHLNKAQRFLHDRLNEQMDRTGRVRALLLKGRQQGFSTYIGGRFYARASLNRGLQTFILTHEQEATNNLFGMVERYHQNNPLRPSTGAANAKELYFDKLDSGYSVGTAGTKAVGRSKTLQLFHGSEVAFWPNAASHFAGAGVSLPDTDSIQADACAPSYRYDMNQRLLLESKDDMRRRGVRSPDEWDAVALTFAAPVLEKTGNSAAWKQSLNLAWIV